MRKDEPDLPDKSLGADHKAGRKLPVTLIAGPTASGKSALAMRVAQERGAIIVNADSMQVYAELRVLTARPSVVDEAAIPHRLYGTRTARNAYSVADWLGDVGPLVEAARNGGPPLVIVGGTGLYFKALTEGLSPVPDIPEEVRLHWRDAARRLSPQTLHAELAARDPATAQRLRPSDPQRIVRALEVMDATGRPLSAWQEVAGTPILREGEAETLYVAPPRALIYGRVDSRLDAMMAAGGLEEVRALVALDLPPDRPAMRAHGVPHFAAHLRGTLSFAAALDRAKLDTRHYVKRQLTWARRNMISWKIISTQ
jgi:tRNA dimethylallyltransferase